MQCAEELASALQNIAPTWCVAMQKITETVSRRNTRLKVCAR